MDADSELRRIRLKTWQPAIVPLVLAVTLGPILMVQAYLEWTHANRVIAAIPAMQRAAASQSSGSTTMIDEMLTSGAHTRKTLAAMLAFLAVGWMVVGPLLARARVRKKRIALYAASNRCTKCGYLLSGSENRGCPECGTTARHIHEQGRSVKNAGKERLFIIDGRCAWCRNPLSDASCLECPKCGAWRPENWAVSK